MKIDNEKYKRVRKILAPGYQITTRKEVFALQNLYSVIFETMGIPDDAILISAANLFLSFPESIRSRISLVSKDAISSILIIIKPGPLGQVSKNLIVHICRDKFPDCPSVSIEHSDIVKEAEDGLIDLTPNKHVSVVTFPKVVLAKEDKQRVKELLLKALSEEREKRAKKRKEAKEKKDINI